MSIELPLITDPILLEEIEKNGKIHEFEPGQYIKMVPIILEGSVKVMRTDEEGHELLLYYIEGGDTCAVSLTCCSTSSPSDIKAVAEERTRVLGVPVRKHEEWANKFRQWKDFVAMTYQKRFQEMLRAIDDVAFRKMDERLLKYLVTKSKQLKTFVLSITHQEIASELGTSWEVISRLLKQLEKRKLVEL
ncbi:Crp/Fnr family transcriptional regulator [Pontibacter harenae]|uniref:Crp/Fnr family transcriptional regulator n=1 Tax=Pontibacter harenae TaxID=2894083 RepID=UPI001E2FD1BF|nr:Crp/Fnr family transcriptional regulator [Pontibacter harenae]MCC9169001.1 Crp/Fnr family transcriptional regulator [Pontibacter harenae]